MHRMQQVTNNKWQVGRKILKDKRVEFIEQKTRDKKNQAIKRVRLIQEPLDASESKTKD